MFRNFKCYRQLETSDCGLACIKMIARRYGKTIPLNNLKEIADMNKLGMSIKDITQTLREFRIDSAVIKIPTEKCFEMPLPAILYWDQKHYVVLYRANRKSGKLYVADPARGKMVYDEDDFNSHWLNQPADKGIAILSEPKENFFEQSFQKEKIIRQFLCYLTSFFKLHKRSFIITLMITILIMASDYVIPILLQNTIDEGIHTKDIGLVWLLLLSQLGIAVGGLVATGIVELLMSSTGLKIHLNMMSNFLARLAKFPLSFFDKRISSDFIQKMQDQQRIKNFLLDFPSSIIMISLSLIVFSILLLRYSGVIFSIVVTMSLLELCWNVLFLNKKKTLDYASFTLASANNNKAYELANGMADLKVNNAEESHIEKWNRNQEELNKVSLKSTWLNKIEDTGHALLSKLKDLTVTGIAAFMVIQGDLTLGMLMTISYITGRLSQPFSRISGSFNSLQGALLSYQRIEEVVNDNGEWRGKEKFSFPEVEMKNLWFKYAGTNSPFVLKNINLTIKVNEVTAFVGESGCGKSTLIKLILGFYIPQDGSLYLSGTDVKEMDNSDWLSHCGVVMQDAKIFSGTILENIALSSKKPDKERVLELLEVVGLKEFITALPMGVNTKIGTEGISMSGGQKQRLIIARALYKDPELLIMDEATSSLDANNEKMIVSRVNKFGKGRTVVIAAHRLSTVQNADKIVFIKDGRIEEIGSHQELIELRGHYWHLVKNQLPLSV